MITYIWPIALAVMSNAIYQICAKSMPGDLNPLASLTITYLVGALCSLLLYIALNRNANLILEYKKLNWAPFALGIVIVGLEIGMIYAYKAGWQVSVASTVCSAFLACVLVVLGFVLYHEVITWNKIVGILFLLAGLAIVNYK